MFYILISNCIYKSQTVSALCAFRPVNILLHINRQNFYIRKQLKKLKHKLFFLGYYLKKTTFAKKINAI